MKSAAPKTLRVAIYCRQSVADETSDFGSLQAQREAVESYVRSQRGEGWVALPDQYDDGGFSGSNTARPAFQRLLADVQAGRADIVAVYKLDRLSRSLPDFVGLMRTFREHGVEFVSVTQQFTTTNPVGRMTLNLLATFAEFERETIAERTRDKIGAARRRGMWTGGRPMLGYDIVEKKLVVNADEADQVRAIFALYLELGSLMATVEELNRRGWHTKAWIRADGSAVPGSRFDKSNLRHMLKSPLYAGRVRQGNDTHPGLHEAIVEQGIWTATQAALKRNGRRGASNRPNPNGLLLRGILHCAVCGSPMQHSKAGSGGRAWSYYVCRRLLKQGAAACPKSRVSVGDIEGFVVGQIRTIGSDPALIRATVAAAVREREERRPGIEAEIRRQEAEKRGIASQRMKLVAAVGQGGRAGALLAERLVELDQECQAAEERAAAAREALVALDRDVIDEAELARALQAFDPIWDELFPRERARILALLIEDVRFTGATSAVEIHFRPSGLREFGKGAA